MAIVCANAVDGDDARELVDALGLTGYVPTHRRPAGDALA